MLHIYHGDGKGKTTAALGLVMRELGHAQKVLVVQFLDVYKRQGNNQWTNANLKYYPDEREPKNGPSGE